jgi:hypothetical protein
MKEKILNSSIQQVANYFKQLKQQGYSLEEIKQIIFK